MVGESSGEEVKPEALPHPHPPPQWGQAHLTPQLTAPRHSRGHVPTLQGAWLPHHCPSPPRQLVESIGSSEENNTFPCLLVETSILGTSRIHIPRGCSREHLHLALVIWGQLSSIARRAALASNSRQVLTISMAMHIYVCTFNLKWIPSYAGFIVWFNASQHPSYTNCSSSSTHHASYVSNLLVAPSETSQ